MYKLSRKLLWQAYIIPITFAIVVDIFTIIGAVNICWNLIIF